MSASATSPASPDAAADRRRSLLDQQLERLDQMAQAGTDLIQALAAQAAGGPKVVKGDVSLAFGRVSRAVRMAILLQRRLIDETVSREADRDGEDDGRALDEAADVGPGTIPDRHDLVEDIAGREGDAPERAERIERETAERLERDDLYGLVHARPVGEIVVDICRDLDLEPDWPTLAQEGSAQVAYVTRNPGAPLAAVMRGASHSHARAPPRAGELSRSD